MGGIILYHLESDQMKGIEEYLLHHMILFKASGVLKLTEACFPTTFLLISALTVT